MKAVAQGAFGAALLASAASAAPLNATTISSLEVSNAEQVRLICDKYGRCWRARGPRYVYVYRSSHDDPSYVAGRGYNYYGGPGYFDRGYGYYRGPRFCIGGW